MDTTTTNQPTAAQPIDLLPCPFCAGEATIYPVNSAIKPFGARCMDCGALGADAATKNDVAGLWNTRALARQQPAASGAGEVAASGKAVAYLHQVVSGDGEPDQALSFAPDNFPLSGTLGFHSIAHVPLTFGSTPESLAAVHAAFDAAILLAGDTINARNAEIENLRAQLASERQAKEYEQRHAAESEKALAAVNDQLAAARRVGKHLYDTVSAPAAPHAQAEPGDLNAARAAFDDRHCGYEFPSSALRSGALDEFIAGWKASRLAPVPQEAEQAEPARIEKLRTALREISEVKFGYDGDCGTTSIANEALYADEQEAEQASTPPPIQLPPLPWGDDFEAWLEVRAVADVERAIHEYASAALSAGPTQEAEQAAPAAALRKLCDQLDGMKRRLRPTPGTGQNHSYLMHEDVAAYVEEARAALTQPAAPAVTDAARDVLADAKGCA